MLLHGFIAIPPTARVFVTLHTLSVFHHPPFIVFYRSYPISHLKKLIPVNMYNTLQLPTVTFVAHNRFYICFDHVGTLEALEIHVAYQI